MTLVGTGYDIVAMAIFSSWATRQVLQLLLSEHLDGNFFLHTSHVLLYWRLSCVWLTFYLMRSSPVRDAKRGMELRSLGSTSVTSHSPEVC